MVSHHRAGPLAAARRFLKPASESSSIFVHSPGAMASGLGRVLAQIAPPGQHPDPERQTCVTAMPRPDFDVFLRLHAPEVADAVPEPDPEWRRQGRTLPILVATAHGHRLACVAYDIE